MKLPLNKEWFENRISADEDFEVGAGVPVEQGKSYPKSEGDVWKSSVRESSRGDDEVAETLAFGTLIELMRRDLLLRAAVFGFAANSPKIAELSHEERVAMTEFVQSLGTQDGD